ncbi:CinA family protein [Amnibacterium endophyticum]|uniref:CinA family protein n=1 Tax=Amnibacterium endophyticum TaxID=2109337 RepID=A0ABW4LH60_9MICO
MTAEAVLALLAPRGQRLAVAESLTGGLLTDAFVRVPGASAVLLGGVVAYETALKSSLLGVDPELLAAEGPVHPEVARQMAAGVRTRLAVGGEPPAYGLATTGVAGPGPQDGRPAGTVHIGIATPEGLFALSARLGGDRAAVRAATVGLAVRGLLDALHAE